MVAVGVFAILLSVQFELCEHFDSGRLDHVVSIYAAVLAVQVQAYFL
jgi:hypothetical protein